LDAIHERNQAEEAREWRDSVETSRGAAIRHLTRSVDLYRRLGLEFHRDGDGDDEGCLRYVRCSDFNHTLPHNFLLGTLHAVD